MNAVNSGNAANAAGVVNANGAASTRPTSTAIDLLANSVLFKGIDPGLLQIIAGRLKEVRLRKGDPVFVENEISQNIYFLIEGSVEIVRYTGQLRQANHIKFVAQGEHFSEFSVLTRSTHSTCCFCVVDSVLLSLDEYSFHEILRTQPLVRKHVVTTLAKINQQMTLSSSFVQSYKEQDFHYSPKLMTLIPHEFSRQYQVLPLSFHNDMLSVGIVNPYNKEFYAAMRLRHPNLRIKVFALSESNFKALQKRTLGSTDVAETRAAKVLVESAAESRSAFDCVQTSQLFSGFGDEICRQIASHAQVKALEAGEILFDVDTVSNHFYIIKSGEAELLMPLKNGGYTLIAKIGEGEILGEIALMLGTHTAFLVVASGKAQVLKFEKNVFLSLVDQVPAVSASLLRILAGRIQDHNRRTQLRYFSGEINLDVGLCKEIMGVAAIQEHKILPISKRENEITLGVVEPDNHLVYAAINRYLSDYRVNIVILQPAMFQSGLDQLLLAEAKPQLKIVSNANTNTNANAASVAKPTIEVVKFIEEVLMAATKARASDIHLEFGSRNFSIRFRIDGELREHGDRYDAEFGRQVLSRLKILANMNIAERRFPQDGHLQTKSDETEIQARVSTVPGNYGEKMVLRLINTQGAVVPLNRLVPDRNVIKFLRQIIRHKQGLFLVTGPTGSGKTTSLYSVLSELVGVESNLITIEDPVELTLVGTTQIQIDESIGLTFDKILRSVLRQDPDTLMVGEIRDAESAAIVVEAALTGKLVLSTLHTNNSLDVITRLKELGIKEPSMASGMIGAMAQRLIPRLCLKCREQQPITEKETKILSASLGNVPLPTMLWHPVGCPQCLGTGFFGRLPAFEFWKMNDGIHNLIVNKGSQQELRKLAMQQGFQSLRAFGFKMVLNGITTIDQVEKYLYSDD